MPSSADGVKVLETHGLDIYFAALPEYESIRDHFRSCGWTRQEIDDLVATDPAWFCARVSAWVGETMLAKTYLGGCCYDYESDFYTKYRNDYFADMVEELIVESAIYRLEGGVV